MDGSQFDTLTRALGEIRSRRGLLRLLGGLPGVASFSLLASLGTAAKGKKSKRSKKRRKKQAATPNCTAPCASTCGAQRDSCGQAVDCGACTDPCAGNPCAPHGVCTTITGTASYTCTCDPGFIFNGVTCSGPCTPSSNPCGPHGVCTATGASTYTCTCATGYVSNGLTCVLQ